MKHKRIIIASTVAVFILATILAFVWLLKIRYVDTYVIAGSTEKEQTYKYVDQTLEKYFGGRSFFSFSEEDVAEKLAENPYVKVNGVKKIFPDRIEVSVEKRVERFALALSDSVCFVTDKEYVYLRQVEDVSALSGEIIKMSLIGVDLNEDTLKIGSKIGYENDGLVGYMTTIFTGFTDGVNLINDVVVKGEENRINFNTKTGVTIEFRFAPSNPNLSESQIKKEELALVGKVKEVENYYLSLTEKKQRIGAILVFTKSNGEILIDHTTETV